MTDQNKKPDYGYDWTPQNNAPETYTYRTPYSDIARNLFFPQDTFEIFSYVTEGRCFALGQQHGVNGVFSPGLEVDMLVWCQSRRDKESRTTIAMRQRMLIGLCVLGGLNLLLFAGGYHTLTRRPTSGPEGIGTAIFLYASLLFSLLLIGFGVNQFFVELRHGTVKWETIIATLIAASPVLFYIVIREITGF